MKIKTLLAGLCLLVSSLAFGEQTQLPDQQKQKHLGVATCSSSTCHGSIQGSEQTRVLQNEYVIWSRQDPHSRGIQTLRSEESARIAYNLGLSQPAHKADICTDCHLDNPDKTARGPKFNPNDGIGCEACHGGAENWLKTHTAANRSIEDNVADGMYPTHKPEARAVLCLSCHLGTDDKFTSHKIMGAGHPRLSFELQTFSEIQPAHFRVDDDYKKRKANIDPIQTWLVGVYANAIAWLELMRSDWLNPATIIPELSLYDCQSCHHSMSDKRWAPRSSKALEPGTVRLADSHLMMVWVLTSQLQADQLEPLKDWLHQLHATSQSSITELKAKAEDGINLLTTLKQKQTQKPLSKKQQKKLLARIIEAANTGLFDDYNAAEQAVLASQLLLRELKPQQYQELIAKVLATVNNEDDFDIGKFRYAMQALQQSL